MTSATRIAVCVLLAAVGACGRTPFSVGAVDLAAVADLGAPPDLAGPDLARPPAPKRVFVTSQLYTANLGGLTGADAKCQLVAALAGLHGTFKAWLSDQDADAATRLTHASVPYVLLDGTHIAADWQALTTQDLEHAINVNEYGVHNASNGTACGGSSVWTDTKSDGTIFSAGNTCGEWTDDSSPIDGTLLGLFASRQLWTQYCSGGGCSNTASLYCFEQ